LEYRQNPWRAEAKAERALMAAKALEMRDVGKKFRKGELYGSLRDAVPGVVRRLLKGRSDAAADAREFWALRDVSLSVERGEVLGIIGHNGAGKSTILKLLSGVLRPTCGSIAVSGRLSALIEIGAGFHPDLTGRENIYLNGTILGMSRAEITGRFDAIVDFSGLEEFLDTPVKRYSTGMYARLGFAVAAHVDPEILIVDEVLSVGDYAFQNKCLARMKEIIRGGAAVLFVSHNLNAVAGLCSRALLLDHGRVVQQGPTQDVLHTYLTETRIETDTAAKDAYISSFVIRGEHGPQVSYQAGEAVWIDVEVKANRPCRRLSLTIFLKDENGYGIFDTSTERMGHPPFSLEVGESYHCTFRLALHLVPGAFHFGTHIYRYDIQRMYDNAFPVGTVFVTSDTDVRGVANLYPQIETSSTMITSAASA
jgi:lipopolysaccharide transport system ATP-binding protein